MYRNFRLTEKEKEQILEQHINKGYKKPIRESFWNSIFGNPSVKDAAQTSMRGAGYSYTGKDDERSGENYIVWNGQKFYPEDIVYAEYQDLGDLPRVENGKLIVSNPAWHL